MFGWDLPYAHIGAQRDDTERTVFVTLVPNPGMSVPSNISLTPVSAALIPYQEVEKRGQEKTWQPVDGQESYSNTQNLILQTNGPHDPNWEKVEPTCMLLKNKAIPTLMKYRVHFQNTGSGNAIEKIRVATSLPYNVPATAITITKWTIAGNTYPYSGTSPNWTFTRQNTPDSVIFLFSPKSSANFLLQGQKDAQPNPWTHPSTMGDVYFEYMTNPGVPHILSSRSAIYFDNEHAVITNEARAEYRECCDCKGKKNDNKPCDGDNYGNPKPKKKSFWKWLKEKC
jgi:hypothetical protein